MMDYDSLKSILHCLDPNKRLELFERCPSIRAPDRKTPIKLDSFKFENSYVEINERKYQLGVVRHYQDVKAPRWVRRENERGGAKFDVGAFASRFPLSRVLRKELLLRDVRDGKPSIQEMIKNGVKEQKLKELLITVKNGDNCSNQEVLEWEINSLRNDIRRYKEQKAVSELKFTNYLLLIKPTISHQREYLCYAFPIRDYLDYLIEFLFGGRTILVDSLKYVAVTNSIWPENVTIRVRRDFEVQWKDNQIFSITYPSKNIYFRIAYLQSLNFTQRLEDITFEVKEAMLEETIGNLLELWRDSIPEQARTQLIRKQFPFRTEFNTTTHKINIAVEKIRDGKMPATRGNYRIEWDRKELSEHIRREAVVQRGYMPAQLFPPELAHLIPIEPAHLAPAEPAHLLPLP
ncbi:hypothetical protein CAEBREN_10948 [Caenorhabditis brenneri]|uniref:F-box C protein n=1 Tax=Caenorhabditis brenneri TaxID=135651 RepID=G0MDH1_CAEBE|nr:hypothetical protein CAEBREN_10948 [Caenorhabditis brenneri]